MVPGAPRGQAQPSEDCHLTGPTVSAGKMKPSATTLRFWAHGQKCLLQHQSCASQPVPGEGPPGHGVTPIPPLPSLCPQDWASTSEMSPGAYTQAHSPTPALQSCSSEPLASPRGHLWCHGAPCNDTKPRPWPWLQTPTPRDPGRHAFSSGLRSPVWTMFWHAPGQHSIAAGDVRTRCGPWTELAQKQVPPQVRDGPVVQKCKKRPFTALASRNCTGQTTRHQSAFFYSAVH